MISLFLSICLVGQPCKEERVADFFTVLSTQMCSTNKQGMQMAARNEKRNGTFECRSNTQPTNREATAKLKFDLRVADGSQEVLELAKFYGTGGKPLCTKNADHYRPELTQAAAETSAVAKLDCVG